MGARDEDDNNGSDGFPDANGADPTVDFGWADDADDNDDSKKLTGRRKKHAQQLKKASKPGSFENMGLTENLLKAIKRKGYRLPTPIQRRAMPLILQGLDVVGMARTGSGKTAAFVIPMVEKLKAHAPGSGARAIILSPTRELALQTHKVVRELAKLSNVRVAALVGGDSMEAQFAELAAYPDVIVATPGRLAHHLDEIDGFGLRSVEYLVFDEADRLFEMGFADQLKAILTKTSPNRQTLLFSATMPKALAEFARAGLKEAELVRLDAETKISPDLSLAFFTVRHDDKAAALLFLCKQVILSGQPTIVFASTRHHVDWLAALLKAENLACAAVHGNMDQTARKIQLAKFRAGKVPFLIVTDVAARGLDIPLLDNVINYDFPSKPKLFVHRAGRAARAGRSGTAYSILTREELPFLLDLHLFLSRPLAPAPVAGIKSAASNNNNNNNNDKSNAADGSIYGCFPQAALDDEVERVRYLLESDVELAGAAHAADNAFKLYKRTRPMAAPESATRAKNLPREGMHPLLAAALPSTALGGLEAQEGLADITARLKSYRPSATVFEAEVAAARKGEGAGTMATPGVIAAGMHERRVDVMKEKRATHAMIIKRATATAVSVSVSAHQKHAGGDDNVLGSLLRNTDDNEEEEEEDEEEEEGKKKHQKKKRKVLMLAGNDDTVAAAKIDRFKEQGFFLSHTPQENIVAADAAERFYAVSGDGLQDAVLDLTAEDAAGQRAQRAQYHWDKRGKKYVKLQPGEVLKGGKRVKTESGKLVAQKGSGGGSSSGKKGGKKEAGGIYEKWSRKTKLRIGAPGGGGGGAGSRGLPSGAREPNNVAHLAGAMADRFKKGGRSWVNPLKAPKGDDGGNGDNSYGNREGKRKMSDELKSPDQVRKQRKLDDRKKEHLAKRKRETAFTKKVGGSSRGGGLSSRGGGRGGSSRGGGGFGARGGGGRGSSRGGSRGGRGGGRGGGRR